MPSWRVAVFTALAALGRGLDLSASGLAYVAVGFLRREELCSAIAGRWEQFGATERHALSGFYPVEETFYPRFLKPHDEILLVGCGTGRDLIALLRAGYHVEGLEVAPRAAMLARRILLEQKLAAPIEIGSIETAPLRKRYDAVLFSWLCYSYIPGRAARVAVLCRVKAHLKAGGRILVTYVLCEREPRRLPRALARGIAQVVRSRWTAEPTDVVSLDSHGIHFEHQFPAGELEDEARQAGLRIVFDAPGDDKFAVLTAAEASGRDGLRGGSDPRADGAPLGW